jgi:hypothetical protein
LRCFFSDRAKFHGVTASALLPMSRGAQRPKYSKVEKMQAGPAQRGAPRNTSEETFIRGTVKWLGVQS